MMDILVSTGSLAPRGIDDSASIARQAGADGLELLLNNQLLTVGPERAVHAASAHQVPIRSVHPPIRFINSRQHVHDDMIAAAEYARAIPDCRVLVMHAVGGASLHSERGRAFFRTIDAVTAILRGSTVRLAIENRGTLHPQPRMDFLDKLQNLYRVCEEWDLDITFDTSHAASFGLNIVPALDGIYPRLANIHFSDRREEPPAIAAGLVNSLTREHQLPGAGALPLASFVQRLRTKGYRGAITLELSPVALAPWRARRAIERTTRAVTFIREILSPEVQPAADPSRRTHHAPAPADSDF
ncbi:MAG: sugar phosphate isomerase/epimerase family protein [Thermomicrobiales bacterium]